MTTDHPVPEHELTDPATFWEARYLTNRDASGQVWSGNVNATVEQQVTGLTPGTALDLGCGEGGDALWLAAQGWTVTAIDLSANALAVGAAKAAHEGLSGRIEWVQADLATWHPSGTFDLVTAAFLHSPVELPREEILRRMASAVSPGGRLLVVGHGSLPPGSSHVEHGQDAPALPAPEEVIAALDLHEGWVIETEALVDRAVTWRDGTSVAVVDTVVRLRRDL